MEVGKDFFQGLENCGPTPDVAQLQIVATQRPELTYVYDTCHVTIQPAEYEGPKARIDRTGFI